MLMMGMALFPGANPGGTGVYGAAQEYMGTQVAGIGDAWHDVYGQQFDSRVTVSMGGQFAEGQGQAFMQAAMNTPDWTSRAYTHHVTAIHFAPYWSFTQGAVKPDAWPSDGAAILATADPLTTLFTLAYTNAVNGRTYDGVATAGYIGVCGPAIAAFMARLAGQPWSKCSLLGYESGDGLGWQGMPDGWQALMLAFQRDDRFTLLYYDPQHRLSAEGEGYLPACKSAGFESLNQFNDVGFAGSNGQYGVLESIMQPVSPLERAPAKYRGFASYIAAGQARRIERGR